MGDKADAPSALPVGPVEDDLSECEGGWLCGCGRFYPSPALRDDCAAAHHPADQIARLTRINGELVGVLNELANVASEVTHRKEIHFMDDAIAAARAALKSATEDR